MRVLVVEDNQVLGVLFRDVLSQLGHETSLVRDAEAARASLGDQRPDAVLLDLALPNMSGIEFLRLPAVRGAGIPVVAISGRAPDHEVQECLRLGALEFVRKPVSLELLRQIMAYVDVKSGGRRLDAAGRPVDQRRSARPSCEVPVRGAGVDGTEWHGMSVDLSVFGISVRPLAPVGPEPAVKLFFTPPDGGMALSLLSVRIRSSDTHVFRFVNLSGTEHQRLSGVVQRLSA
jgi:CheY-like chemotaxis protein